MIRSTVWLVASVAIAGLASGVASAQGNLKIGVVSIGRLIEQSPQYEAASKKVEEEFGPRRRDLEAMQQRLRGQTEQFQRDAPVMGEEERVNLERQIRDAGRELQRSQTELAEDFQVRQREELDRIQREVLAQAQEYARAQKFDLLLAGDQTAIFASTAVDVTEAVLAAMKPAAAPAR